MIETAVLAWRFLLAQTLDRWLEVVPWHLLALLCVLGLLSALGLHYAIGHVLGFYRRKDRLSGWIAAPTLVVFLVALQLLLAAYLLGTQSEALVERDLAAPGPGRMAGLIGHLLLEPAFAAAGLAQVPPEGVPKHALVATLKSIKELDYREALRRRLDELKSGPPERPPPVGQGQGVTPAPPAEGSSTAPAAVAPPGLEAETVMAEVALHWATDPNQSAPPPPENGDAPRAGVPQGEQPFFLPDFIKGLVDELDPQVVLTRPEWDHVAGTNFIESILRPVLEEYLSVMAAAIAVVVLLVCAGYFALIYRLKRLGRPKPAKKGAPRKLEPKPEPKPVSAPASPPVEAKPPLPKDPPEPSAPAPETAGSP